MPNTSPGNRRNHFTFCKVLTAVNPESWNGSGFDGTLFAPGVRVSAEEIQAHPVVLEFAGPQGNLKEKRQKNNLWILWKYDREARDFQELARAVAHNWNWALILRGPALQALAPRLEGAVDPCERAGLVLEAVLTAIDSVLSPEPPAVLALVLSALYDRVSGRLTRLD